MVHVDIERGCLTETEIDAFVNDRWLVTVRKDAGFSIDPALERWDRSPDIAARGVSFLLYGLLDVVVDGYFDAVQAFDDYYAEVSDSIFSERPSTRPSSGGGSTCVVPWSASTVSPFPCARP